MTPTCWHCERVALQPIVTTTKESGAGAPAIEQTFCSWRCAAEWFSIQADLHGESRDDSTDFFSN